MPRSASTPAFSTSVWASTIFLRRSSLSRALTYSALRSAMYFLRFSILALYASTKRLRSSAISMARLRLARASCLTASLPFDFSDLPVECGPVPRQRGLGGLEAAYPGPQPSPRFFA